MKCKYCGEKEVGRKAIVIVYEEQSMLNKEDGTPLTAQEFIDYVSDSGDFGTRNKNQMIAVVEDRDYCFECDRYQDEKSNEVDKLREELMHHDGANEVGGLTDEQVIRKATAMLNRL